MPGCLFVFTQQKSTLLPWQASTTPATRTATVMLIIQFTFETLLNIKDLLNPINPRR